MKAAVRREAPAVAAVVVAVLAVLAPLTLGGRLASSADTDAFYAPFASFLHDRLAAGDLPFWAPGAFSGQPFLADAQSGVTYPPMLLASWLLGPVDALRAVATFHYLIAAPRHVRAGAAAAREPHGLRLRRDRVRRLRAPRRALGRARAAGWRSLARAGTRAGGGHGERAAGTPRLRDRRPGRRARAAPGQRLAAARRAHAGDLRALAARARGRAGIAIRGRGDCARIRPRGAGTAPAARVAARSNRFGLRRSRRHRLAPVRRPARPGRALRRLALGDRDALPGRGDPGARAARLAARSARRCPGAAAGVADRVLAGLGDGPDRLAHGPAAAGAHGDRARARARNRARAAVPQPPRRVRPAGAAALARRA